ncbi:MAG: tetraacyldisaccharide 4'-kinase [Crocinitomicaceae bacterium]|nr:tetraacyldisaccharide 4'-kinase [Crocinitomicaceae bacterium]
MQIIRFLLFPFALIYGFIVLLRNFFYDSRFFKSSRFSMPIICVGNLSMGGTGKTPHTEYLIRLLKDKYKVATLSRGFGRKERDFRIADNHATALNLGDEPLQYHLKFKDEITVAVEANRVHGVMDICLQKPETNLILLDDAYQHRAIHAGFNILLTSYNEPFYTDFMVPLGNLREFRAGKKRADVVIVTKCPDFGKINKAEIAARLKLLPAQRLFFSRINYGKLISLKDASALENSSGNQIVLVTGIANSKTLVDQLSINNEILHHFNYRDHHTFSVSDLTEIHNLFDKFASPQTILVTTEKDAMRLIKSEFEKTLKNYPWYYQEIQVELDNSAEFDKLILEYAEKNS